jgi:hypothetical protein
MAFINKHKTISVKTELDLFAVPPTQTSVENGEYIVYRPQNPLSTEAPIEFTVTGSSEQYIDLAHTMLYLTAKISREVKRPGAAGEEPVSFKVAPVNNWLHSMFSQVDVYLNKVCVSPPSNCYNYRAYIENLLNYDSGAKRSHLQTSFWYKDSPGEMDFADNGGCETRETLSANTKIVEMFSNVHVDLFNQDKYLLNGVELGLKFIPARASFHLMSDEAAPKFKFEITNAELYVRKMQINPAIKNGISLGLLTSPAKYPITRVDIKQLTLPSPIQSKTIDNLYMGQIPKRCIIGMVKNTAFNGTYKTNPFNFEHFNLNYLAVYVDSTQILSRPFTPDFTRGLYAREYHSLFSGCGIHYSDHGNDVEYDDYSKGFFLTCFDLTNDLSSHSPVWNASKNGSLRIELRFEQPLTESVTVIVFAEFDNLIEIDKNRQITLDYSS